MWNSQSIDCVLIPYRKDRDATDKMKTDTGCGSFPGEDGAAKSPRKAVGVMRSADSPKTPRRGARRTSANEESVLCTIAELHNGTADISQKLRLEAWIIEGDGEVLSTKGACNVVLQDDTGFVQGTGWGPLGDELRKILSADIGDEVTVLVAEGFKVKTVDKCLPRHVSISFTGKCEVSTMAQALPQPKQIFVWGQVRQNKDIVLDLLRNLRTRFEHIC